MIKLTLIAMIAIASSCGTPHRKRPIQIHRPIATDTKTPIAPTTKVETGGENDGGSSNNPAPQEANNDQPSGQQTDNQDVADPSKTIASYNSDRLQVTSGTTDSVATFQFTGVDARKLYKLMSVAPASVTGSPAKYHYSKRGQNLACDRLVYAADLNTPEYRCKLSLNSLTGTAAAATNTVIVGKADEKLTSAYNGSIVAVSPANANLIGSIRIVGADAKTLFDNLAAEDMGGKKVGTNLTCATGSSSSCVLAFQFESGLSLSAN